ncbi:MAG TPA: DUF4331 domain-containing protein [Solirubrobacteraceae bacterium]|nr:DUF4331 domain-containing protein [Solirubrobacteraceae bacterium]
MRKLPLLAAALAAALAAGALAVTLGFGSSHREAPLTSLDPTGDDTDLYAFTAPDAPGSLTLVANWIPFEDPAGGPNFYKFDDRASYYLNIDNTGDGRADVRYRFKFRTRVRNPNSFLYALPGVTGIGDSKLNVVQTYSIRRERYRNGREVSSRQIASGLPVAPNNVGPKTIPNYDAVAAQAIRSLRGGGKVFAGQADDPFFVDLGTAFDAINIRSGTGNAGGGKDDLAGYNVHSIVLQVPEAHVTRDARPVSAANAANAVVGVWASTERQTVRVTGGDGERRARTEEVQVSRLGNPLVNEVVIPLGQKDKFNATEPKDDLANFGRYVLSPELAKVMNTLFPGVNAPTTNRTDIVQALLTGIPGLTQIRAGAPPTDTLKINLGTAPNPSPKRFGVLAGDTQGFPNGRRLADDVTDIELRVIAGFLKGNKVPLGDGVDQNDKPFRATFPYVAPPASGFDSQLKRNEPAHAPTPADPAGT